ncbi:hypothetical protein CDAR_471271 [Caerostris darwini]|uniref:Uncharacterized protein n=1 Tax=Caerostris darwini TaxID=1538125 RepID=A0AAV4QM27_9ARAC|nr:hypothetical protein CDAR_471271 [Caerostris darwini]
MGIYARVRGVPFVLPRNLFLCSRRLPSRSVISAEGSGGNAPAQGPVALFQWDVRFGGMRSERDQGREGPENGQDPRGYSPSHPSEDSFVPLLDIVASMARCGQVWHLLDSFQKR